MFLTFGINIMTAAVVSWSDGRTILQFLGMNPNVRYMISLFKQIRQVSNDKL